MSNMVLPANQKTTVKHSVKLAPTDSINDDHLAGYFVYNNNGNYEPVTSLYGASVEGESIQFQMQTVKEHSVDKYYTSAEAFTAQDKTPYIKENHFGEHQIVNHSENLVGHPEHYIVGETGYFDNTTTINYLELGSFTKEDREFIDGQYIYLRRSGTTNNSTWQLINESDVPNNINFNNRNVYLLHFREGFCLL